MTPDDELIGIGSHYRALTLNKQAVNSLGQTPATTHTNPSNRYQPREDELIELDELLAQEPGDLTERAGADAPSDEQRQRIAAMLQVLSMTHLTEQPISEIANSSRILLLYGLLDKLRQSCNQGLFPINPHLLTDIRHKSGQLSAGNVFGLFFGLHSVMKIQVRDSTLSKLGCSDYQLATLDTLLGQTQDDADSQAMLYSLIGFGLDLRQAYAMNSGAINTLVALPNFRERFFLYEGSAAIGKALIRVTQKLNLPATRWLSSPPPEDMIGGEFSPLLLEVTPKIWLIMNNQSAT